MPDLAAMEAAVAAVDPPLLVMLSGGRDSVCLLDLAVRAHGVARVTALHVNYGLRPEADGDEAHCRALCERLRVTLHVEAAGAAPETGNLQAWARDVRYAAAAQLALAAGSTIVTAHTRSDQAETVLYRLASSPGRRALLGMRPRDGRLARPLLAFSREDTGAWCRAHGLAWRDDATNADLRFTRARARHGLLPTLRELHPAAEANVARTAELLRDEAAVLDELVGAETAGGAIAIARLRELSPALRRLVVQRLADDAAGRLVPGAARRAEEIAAMDGGALDVGGGVRAIVAGGTLRFGPSEGRAAPRRRVDSGP